jgi:hypothetical protein
MATVTVVRTVRAPALDVLDVIADTQESGGRFRASPGSSPVAGEVRHGDAGHGDAIPADADREREGLHDGLRSDEVRA